MRLSAIATNKAHDAAWKNVSAVRVRVRLPPALWMTSVPRWVGAFLIRGPEAQPGERESRAINIHFSIFGPTNSPTARSCRSDSQYILNILGDIAAMKGPVRRVVFNPTSIPELRTRAFTQSTRTIPGRQALRSNPWVWNTIRNESTVIGKDASGHIETQANEAILFFDSELCDCSERNMD